MNNKLLLAMLVLGTALGAGPASANALSAPDTVYADPDGHFSYRFTCTVAPDSTLLAGIGWDNGTNVSGAVHGDCFCYPNCFFGPDEELSFDVAGSLVEQLIPGTVDNWTAFCDDPDLHATTTVMPNGPLAVLPVTWGRIKSRYR